MNFPKQNPQAATPLNSRLEPSQMEHHIEWLRQLARSLVRDPGLADDLVQETALAALKAPPALSEEGPRRWLGRVLRHRLSDAKRQSRSRIEREEQRAHESSAAGGGSAPAGDDLVAQVEAERALSEELLRLDEPMRQTLMLRFYEGLPPRRMARRQGVPVATVKSRLARGLAHMRRNLDERHGGDRRLWMAAVLPMAKKAGVIAGGSASALTLGGLAMNVKVTLAITAAAAVGGTLYLLVPPAATSSPRPGVTEGADPAPAGEPIDLAQKAGGGLGEVARESGRSALAASSPKSEGAGAAAPLTMYDIEGLVLDAEARAVTGVPIELSGDSAGQGAAALSGSRGRFTLTTPQEAGTLVAAAPTEAADVAPEWVTVRPGTFRAVSVGGLVGAAVDPPLVIVAPAITLEGIVVDDWGAPAPGVQVILDLPLDFVARFDQSHAKSIRRDWRVTTGEDGRFTLAQVPAVSGATIEVTRPDGTSVRIDAPVVSATDLRLVLTAPPIPIERRLAGRVLHPDGTGAAGARVALGAEMVNAADDGSFELDLRRAGAAPRIAAIVAGAQMATAARPGEAEGERGGWPDFIELRLPGPALAIAGRVVDAEGRPKAGARVWLNDPTEFGFLGAFPIRAEGVAGGLDDPSEAARSRGRLIDSDVPMAESTATVAESPNSMLPFTVTDAEGRFEVEGLLDRRYVLNVVGPNLDYGMQSESIRAGEGSALLELPEGGVFPRVRGRLVTRRGEPLSGVFVTPWLGALAKDFSIRGGRSSVTRFFYAKGARSDKDGAFEFTDVPMQHIQFWIAGDGVSPASRSVSDITDPLDFEIELAARTEVSVEIVDASSGIDSITAQGFDGAAQQITRIFADGSTNVGQLELENGRTGVFALTTDAATITLMRGLQAVEVIDLTGDTGAVQQIVR